MELFVQEPELKFDPIKVANVQLDEDPQSWARQVLTELFRQVPESSEYTPKVMFAKVDKEQGFGLGVVVVSNTTDSALSTVRPGDRSKKVFVPVLVKNHLLCPLDLIMTKSGKMVPLNGHRLRQTLFRPETFEMVTDDWGDTTLYNMFYPPGRSDNDFGAGISQGSGGGTQGAVTLIQGPGMKYSSLLDSVIPTLFRADIDRVSKELDSDPALLKQASENEALLSGLAKIAQAEGEALAGTSHLYKLAVEMAPVSVVQMGYSELHQGYWVKTASRSAFYHKDPEIMSRGEFLKWAEDDAVVRKVDTDGVVTMTTDAPDAEGRSVDQSVWEVIERPGIYKVKTIHGKELTGWVLPNLIDMDGTQVPMSVFTNGSQAMVQDQIVGAHIAAGVDLPSAPAKGSGVFYCAGQGGIMATVPLVVVGEEGEMGGGDSYLVRTLLGQESKVRLVPGLKALKALGNEFHLPASAKFLPLNDEGMVPLVSSTDQIGKTAADLSAPKAVLYGGDAHEVSLRFENMPKLASMFPARQDHETAIFALCVGGCSPQEAHIKLAQARSGETVTITGLSDIQLAKDIIDETRKVASDSSKKVMALRHHLLKEASVLPDVMTVDAVLSLGFINSENVRMFVSRIPYLEKVLSMLCEMLLASRLGLSEIPEHATARCVRAMDETIQGLKALSMREVTEGGFGKS